MHRPLFRALSLASLLAACGGNNTPPPADGGIDTGSGEDAGIDAGAEPDAGAGLPDLTVDGPAARDSAHLVWQEFPPGDCAIAEGCIAAPGRRRLLLFDTFTPNLGTADLVMGNPMSTPELFEYSACHMHYHFNGYADYRLLDASGAEVGMGHKQAFCLEDTERVDPSAPASARYNCGDQGIQRGWGDLYYSGLTCQWIDVTDVAPGSYMLRISINGERRIEEISYDDNVVSVPVTIDDPTGVDPLAACSAGFTGPRDCGWTNAGSFDCVEGTRYRVGCGAGCGLGTCGGTDPILRVCPGDAPCSSRDELVYGDDGCTAGGADQYCPIGEFTCPVGGRYTVLTAPWASGDAYTCTPGAMALP